MLANSRKKKLECPAKIYGLSTSQNQAIKLSIFSATSLGKYYCNRLIVIQEKSFELHMILEGS
jgi:hypothetical protein